jgi:hypothetical protein
MYTVYRESGSTRKGTIQFHRTGGMKTKAAAIKKACTLSKRTKGFVVVQNSKGFEVAACSNGKCNYESHGNARKAAPKTC